MPLPGVKVGPLDPDSTSEFGQVSAKLSARSLIREHQKLIPQVFVTQAARKRDAERTRAVRDNLSEVEGLVKSLKTDDGDPLLPKGAKLIDAAVHGEERDKQVLIFQYEMPSGRVGKWFCDYDRGKLKRSSEEGDVLADRRKLAEKGVVQLDQKDAELDRVREEVARLRAENESLRAQGGPSAVEATAQANVPVAGEPVEGYDELRADQVKKLLAGDGGTPQLAASVLAYERSHANRRSVCAAAEKALG